MNSSAGSPPDQQPDGKLLDNLVYFCRALRAAGLPVGPGQISAAVRALDAAGISNRQDFFWILHACLVTRLDHGQVFRQIFRLFWRDPRYHEHMMSLLLPMVRGAAREQPADAAARRAADALLGGPGVTAAVDGGNDDEDVQLEIDASDTTSGRERLQTLDFEQMTNAEMAEARRVIATFSLPVAPLRSRRKISSQRGRFADWRSTMRAAVKHGGEIQAMQRREARTRWPNLVGLCDISGSMSVYSRTLLRFLHAVSGNKGPGWSRVYAFTFGTRLTNITRQLRIGDADMALAAAGVETRDWDGGTRIGECLRTFNRDWSRRIMGQGAIVLLISDGLDSGCAEQLEREVERLRLSARRLIWINPLLRWEGFAPRAAGIVRMLPHVDCFKSGHNLQALTELAGVIARADDSGEKSRLLAEI